MEKPSLPSGTRDFGPDTMLRRKYLMGTIEEVFRLFGFRPLETPALENLRTLQGKYGDEGDQLLFKVLNNGDFLAKAPENLLQQKDSKSLTSHITDRGLRYDLTVPLARFVVMNSNQIQFPFRRYQMQPVWRADRPQRGRYREFWQCDADVVGSKSVLNEADLTGIYDEVFCRLGLGVRIRLNHRGIFDSMAEYLGGTEQLLSFMQLIDKADKIGFEGVLKELETKAIPNATETWTFLHTTNALRTATEKLQALKNWPGANPGALAPAIAEMETLFSLCKDCRNPLDLDLTLARGLSYYTGTVFEVVPADDAIPESFSIGSIGGGGRYDNLTGVFGLKDVPGVGISFGLDRIYDIIEAAGKFPDLKGSSTRVLICPMLEAAYGMAYQLAGMLRNEGISCEVYPGAAKLKKQLDYANHRQAGWAVILGETEIENQTIALKNLETGNQENINISEIKNHLHLWQS
ncbi:MAG: histidine--tRNA ligase [Bacteroidetes bacterium]|nr:histidine--tRNA ligase [Bacteroidota bacterium]